MNRMMAMKTAEWKKCAEEGKCPMKLPSIMGQPTPCSNGMAGEYPCKNVDLLAYVSTDGLGSFANGNDIWGWTDPQTQKEYAIVATSTGTSFVDISTPTQPCVLGFLKTQTSASSWRDVKVYKDHAFIVSEASNHGMQIYDLRQLRGLTCGAIRQFTNTAFYNNIGNTHNIAINEETGFAYAVGCRQKNHCNAGLHIVDIRDPVNPKFAGCFGQDGYVHDTQCVIYDGPDTRYTGNEICFCYNEDSLTIVDVTNKNNMEMISRTEYQGYQYTHQGWLLPNSAFLLMDDELDEITGPNRHTRTMLWDVRNLENPSISNSFYSTETVVDHNLYTRDNRAYLSNYCAGLRIYDTTRAFNGGLMTEVGYFDVAPDCDTTNFLGSWSSYVYFPSRTIVVNSIERGLFVLKFNDPAN